LARLGTVAGPRPSCYIGAYKDEPIDNSYRTRRAYATQSIGSYLGWLTDETGLRYQAPTEPIEAMSDRLPRQSGLL